MEGTVMWLELTHIPGMGFSFFPSGLWPATRSENTRVFDDNIAPRDLLSSKGGVPMSIWLWDSLFLSHIPPLRNCWPDNWIKQLFNVQLRNWHGDTFVRMEFHLLGVSCTLNQWLLLGTVSDNGPKGVTDALGAKKWKLGWPYLTITPSFHLGYLCFPFHSSRFFGLLRDGGVDGLLLQAWEF